MKIATADMSAWTTIIMETFNALTIRPVVLFTPYKTILIFAILMTLATHEWCFELRQCPFTGDASTFVANTVGCTTGVRKTFQTTARIPVTPYVFAGCIAIAMFLAPHIWSRRINFARCPFSGDADPSFANIFTTLIVCKTFHATARVLFTPCVLGGFIAIPMSLAPHIWSRRIDFARCPFSGAADSILANLFAATLIVCDTLQATAR
jgi:hypothetical protein